MRSRIVALSLLLSAAAFAWPTTAAWDPIQISGADATDACGDISGNAFWDAVGDSANPAAFTSDDGANAWFRIRLNAAPYHVAGGRQRWRSFAWGALLEVDGDLSKYDYMLVVDGNNDTVELWENSIGAAS